MRRRPDARERAADEDRRVAEGEQGAVGAAGALHARYPFLPLKVRLELAQRLQRVGDRFPLEGLYYDSFARRYGGRAGAW